MPRTPSIAVLPTSTQTWPLQGTSPDGRNESGTHTKTSNGHESAGGCCRKLKTAREQNARVRLSERVEANAEVAMLWQGQYKRGLRYLFL